MGSLKYGMQPVRPAAVRGMLQFKNYVTMSALPAVPEKFGHQGLVPDWGMLLNDRIGDCAIAGSLHETMLWNTEANKTVTLNTSLSAENSAAVNYAAVTGYQPGPELEDPSSPPNPSDQGTDVPTLINYRLNTGLIDGSGQRHKIGAAVALDAGDWDQLIYAAYYFDGVGVGINCPSQWQEAFADGKPWTALRDPDVDGGHYITAVGYGLTNPGMIDLVTWGAIVSMTKSGYAQASTQTFAYLSEEKLLNGIDLEGLNLTQLRTDIQELTEVK